MRRTPGAENQRPLSTPSALECGECVGTAGSVTDSGEYGELGANGERGGYCSCCAFEESIFILAFGDLYCIHTVLLIIINLVSLAFGELVYEVLSPYSVHLDFLS